MHMCVCCAVLAVVAAPCNKILAQPGTITGSIGVIFMKLNVKEALQEYGVDGDSVSFGDNADWTSGLHSLTPKQQQQVGQLRPCRGRGLCCLVPRTAAPAAAEAAQACRRV